MRTATLILSVLVHGGAIGALAAVGAYASTEIRELPRVEILASVASAPSAERVPNQRELMPPIVPESSPMPAELPEDPIVPERLLRRDVIEEAVVVAPARFQVSLARIVPAESTRQPAEEQPVVEPVEPVDPAEPAASVEPPPVTPAPAAAYVAASPRAGNLTPKYPDRERALGREGTVVLEVVVDREGRVVDVEVVQGSYPAFNRSALAAVRKWRFEPGMRDGVAVEDRIPVTIEFRIEGD